MTKTIKKRSPRRSPRPTTGGLTIIGIKTIDSPKKARKSTRKSTKKVRRSTRKAARKSTRKSTRSTSTSPVKQKVMRLIGG